MTNEECIKLLDEITSYCDFTDEYGDMINSEPYDEALDMAKKSIIFVDKVQKMFNENLESVFSLMLNALKEQQTNDLDALREAYNKGYEYGAKDWFEKKNKNK